MADGCGTGKEPPCLGAAAALRRWEQLRRRAAAPWARGLLAVAAGLGLFYAALRVPLRLRDGLAAGEAGGERGGGAWRGFRAGFCALLTGLCTPQALH